KPRGKFANLGGGAKCKKCEKTVGFADKVKGPKNKDGTDALYHLNCFRCSTCDKLLKGGEYSENEGFPYCKICYARGFGPKGFGFGGSVAFEDLGGNDADRQQASGFIEEESIFSI